MKFKVQLFCLWMSGLVEPNSAFRSIATLLTLQEQGTESRSPGKKKSLDKYCQLGCPLFASLTQAAATYSAAGLLNAGLPFKAEYDAVRQREAEWDLLGKGTTVNDPAQPGRAVMTLLEASSPAPAVPVLCNRWGWEVHQTQHH